MPDVSASETSMTEPETSGHFWGKKTFDYFHYKGEYLVVDNHGRVIAVPDSSESANEVREALNLCEHLYAEAVTGQVSKYGPQG